MSRKLTPRRDLELGVIIVGEEEMRELNRRHLSGDGLTDVISFPLMEPADLQRVAGVSRRAVEPVGDIAICLDVARRQALERGVSLQDEVEALAAHGLAHIFGYSEDTEEEAVRMLEVELMLTGRSIIG